MLWFKTTTKTPATSVTSCYLISFRFFASGTLSPGMPNKCSTVHAAVATPELLSWDYPRK